jgi:Holliday junction DNA helicase RuvA
VIAAVRGILEAQGVDWVLVDVGGVSLRIAVPATTTSRLPALGQMVRLVTHLYLREDAIALYGFLTVDDLALFEQLITVTGVGPRLALGILSAAPAEALRGAIASDNVDLLTRIPGIGKKLAGRLILELRGKLTAPSGPPSALGATPESDLLDALVGLGYAPADAQAALRSLPTDESLDLEERLRLALQYFARRG